MMNNTAIQNLSRYAPLVSFFAIIAIIVTGYASKIDPDKITAYHARIELTTKSIPFRIGSWMGEKKTVAESAKRLLKPNAVLQRRYQNYETGSIVDVLLVHCGTINDMGGHYPLNCYPAMGWQGTGEAPASVPYQKFPRKAKQYTFERSIEGQRRGLRITNFFVIPSSESPIIHNLPALRKIGEVRSRDGLGVAQVQIVTDDNMPLDEREQVVAEFMRALEPAIKVIGDGIQ